MTLMHKKAEITNATLFSTEVPPGSHIVRLLPTGNDSYDRLIIVVERDEGRELFLMGWMGEPLTLTQWREAAAELFPKAEYVSFERRRKDGSFHNAKLKINP